MSQGTTWYASCANKNWEISAQAVCHGAPHLEGLTTKKNATAGIVSGLKLAARSPSPPMAAQDEEQRRRKSKFEGTCSYKSSSVGIFGSPEAHVC
jgi:hypothetical protein